jgi:hypothetical protein
MDFTRCEPSYFLNWMPEKLPTSASWNWEKEEKLQQAKNKNSG